MRTLAFTATALLATGCLQQSAVLKKDSPLLQPGQGLVVASLGYQRSPETAGKLWAEMPDLSLMVGPAVDDPTLDKFFISTSDDGWGRNENLIESGTGRRMLLAYPVRAGRYRFIEKRAWVKVEGRDYRLPGGGVYPPFEFEVRAGHVTYVGAYELHTTLRQGYPIPGSGSIVTVDRQAADLDRLRQLRPEAAGLAVDNALRAR